MRRHCPGEIALRQMRPLVGQRGLRADQRDLAVKARVAKTRRGRVAGWPGADDYCFGGKPDMDEPF